jgi:hypothetical protein
MNANGYPRELFCLCIFIYLVKNLLLFSTGLLSVMWQPCWGSITIVAEALVAMTLLAASALLSILLALSVVFLNTIATRSILGALAKRSVLVLGATVVAGLGTRKVAVRHDVFS